MAKQWIFKTRPEGRAAQVDDFELVDCPAPDPPGEGELLLQPHLLSVDPTMRNAIAGPGNAAMTSQTSSYYKMMNWELGKAPAGRVVAVVLEAGPGTDFKVGDLVVSRGPWQMKFKVNVTDAGLAKCHPDLKPESNLATLATGLAAYLPVKHIGKPKEGEVAFVSGCAGMTGICAAQCLRNMGCKKVVGSAGTDEKCAVLEKLGIASFNYKKEAPLAALQRLCPEGIDIYFDNVGAEHLEAALEVMKDFGRIIACGSISQYDVPPEKRYGVRNLFHVVAKSITFQGFITTPVNFPGTAFDDAKAELTTWLKEGKVEEQVTFREGFDQLPSALLGLFKGENVGKMLVRVPLP